MFIRSILFKINFIYKNFTQKLTGEKILGTSFIFERSQDPTLGNTYTPSKQENDWLKYCFRGALLHELPRLTATNSKSITLLGSYSMIYCSVYTILNYDFYLLSKENYKSNIYMLCKDDNALILCHVYKYKNNNLILF